MIIKMAMEIDFSFVGKLYGIAEKIDQYLLHPSLVSAHFGYIIFNFEMKAMILFVR